MKKFKFFGFALAALALVGLASCKEKGPTAEEVLAGFNPTVTTVSATYKSNYNLVVNSDNASFKAFEEDVNETTTIELDLTAGDLYLYAKNGEKEVLVYKDGSTYKYSTTDNWEVPALADEAAAKAKINELLKDITFRKAGWLTLDSLTYDIDEYAHREFMLSTLNIPAEDVEEPTMTVTEEKGLSLAYTLEYVCFTGDSGIFELKENEAGANAATVTTDSTGLVTSYNVSFNASTNLALTSDGVPLDLAGSRSLSATYGAALTKKTSINHAAEPKTVAVTVKEATNGSYTVAWFDYAKGNFTMNPVANGDQVVVGMWLGIKVTPAEGYKVAQVKVNGKTTKTVVNGIYCFEVKDEAQTTEVVYVPENAALEATVNLGATENGTYSVIAFTIVGQAFNQDFEVENGAKLAYGQWLGISDAAAEGYEVAQVKVNDKVIASKTFGYYCFQFKGEAAELNVSVTYKAVGSSEQGGQQQPAGLKYTGQFGPQPVEFTFDLATSKGTYKMIDQTYTFDFVNTNGVVTVSNFNCESVVITSITFAANFGTAEVVASYMGQTATFTITKVDNASQGGQQGGQQQPAGFRYTGQFGPAPVEFTFDLATGKGTYTMQNQTYTFDFTNSNGVVTVTNFNCESVVITSITFAANFATAEVVASFNGNSTTFTITKQ